MRISRRHFLVAGAALPAFAQISGTTIPNPIAPQGPLDYYCPMDKDVRSDKPGKCPKCGMTLLLGIPDQTEYPLDVIITPEHFHAGEKVEIAFTIKNPKDDKTVKDFTIVHEKLFHMFIVSSDLKYWIHDHPVFGEDGVFRYEETFPKPGMYRILGDFFPTGGIPQLVSRTVFVPGKSGEEAISMDVPKLEPD